MNIHFLGYYYPWFGKYIGYENMIPFLKGITARTTLDKDTKLNRVIGKAIGKLNGWSDVRNDEALTGWMYKRAARNYDLSHILYVENYLFLLRQSLHKERIIGTIHLPLSRWTKEN